MFDADTFAALDPLVDQVLDLPDSEREQFLARLKHEQPRIAAQLVRLLTRLDDAGGFLEQDAEKARDDRLLKSLEFLREAGRNGDLPPGHVLGHYRIDRVLGRGLLTTVYLASREEEGWTQQVAIKLMARGINSDDVLRRFLSERQILTELRYPGICTLLDGGLNENGMPYFVMEYIQGVAITEYCRMHSVGLADRLRLFDEVCEAVGHAHRHLVVHRDIKPENVMVTQNGRVKLLDFGIAKLLQQGKALGAAVTQVDIRPMTPAYSSPEQFAGEPVTTSTDVYQLGLLLAEMLSGLGSPLEFLGIHGGSPPSRELSRVPEIETANLPYPRKALQGDLEWIVLKCLEPAPSDRYGSAEELRADINCYLQDRPVTARKATFPYLVRKFARRRPGLALSVALVLMASMVFIAMLSYFNVNLARERTAAVEAATRADEVKELLVQLITSADPYRGSGADTRVSELLADSQRVLEDDLGHRPELQAELFGTLADVYAGLSMPGKSAQLRQQQLDLLLRLRGEGSFEVLEARHKLALSRGPSEPTGVTLASLEAVLAELEENHPDQWLERATITRDIGNLLHEYGHNDDAVGYAEHSVAILRRQVDSQSELASSLLLLGTVSVDVVERLEHHREAADILATQWGSEHPTTLSAYVSVASTLSDLARFSESLELFDRVVPVMERELGSLHVQTISAINNRAVCLSRMGENDAAIAGFQDALRRDRQLRGSEHRDIANRQQNLGAMLNRVGQYEKAIEALNEAARIYGNVNLPGNYSTAFPHITLADIYGKLGDAERLESHARRALDLLDGNLPDDHHAVLKSRCLLGDALIRKGQRAEGAAMVEAVIRELEGRAIANPRLADECAALLASES